MEHHRPLRVIIVISLQELREQVVALRRAWVDGKVSEVLHGPALARKVLAILDRRLVMLIPEVVLVPQELLSLFLQSLGLLVLHEVD